MVNEMSEIEEESKESRYKLEQYRGYQPRQARKRY